MDIKMELDLKVLREEINKTDCEIVELFKKRMECAIMVAIDNELDDENSDL